MRQDMATEREESRDEMALRATLHAHASEMVDTEAAWESGRAAPGSEWPLVTRQRRRRSRQPAGLGDRGARSLRRSLAAVLLASLGALAGFAYSRGCFWGGSSFICSNLLQPDGTNYFDKVNQSQEQHGVTVTITSAYADRGATLIGYRATMTPKLASQWGAAYLAVMTVRSGSGELVGALGDKSSSAAQGGLCDDPARNQGETVCYLPPWTSASRRRRKLDLTEHRGLTGTTTQRANRFLALRVLELPVHRAVPPGDARPGLYQVICKRKTILDTSRLVPWRTRRHSLFRHGVAFLL